MENKKNVEIAVGKRNEQNIRDTQKTKRGTEQIKNWKNFIATQQLVNLLNNR